MKLSKIIHRYILWELIPPFLICLGFLTFVFLMTRILTITNMVVNHGADLMSIMILMGYTLPRFMEFTIPMSIMIAILLTFMRMSGDNEILSMKASGISITKILPPVLIFCFIGATLTMAITVYAVAWGKLSFKTKTMEIARSGIDMTLKERCFNSQIKGIMIYVSQVDIKSRKLADILIEDRRAKAITTTTTAPSGQLIVSNDENLYTIRLFNGMIHQVDTKNNTSSTIHFSHYDINIDLNSLLPNLSELKKDFDESSLKGLIQELKNPELDQDGKTEILMLINEKFSIPFACIFLGLVAFPLGIRSLSLRQSSGFGMGIFIFLLYYFLLAAGWSAGEARIFSPFIAMWLPNIVMGLVGLYFLHRTIKERPLFPSYLIDIFVNIYQKFGRKPIA